MRIYVILFMMQKQRNWDGFLEMKIWSLLQGLTRILFC